MNASHSEAIPGRSVSVAVAAAIRMASGFAALYFSTLPIFLKPLASEFGWGRAQTAAATLAAELGMALGAVLVGRLLDKLGPAKVIAVSISAMAAATATLSLQQGSLVLFGLMSFVIGLLGVATTPLHT
ncbi:MAG: MFS transporter [Burkholderiaceae bacterium]|nr:MFS transporter [Burkholderiaceae bacterium]